jgi:iron complex outermembrane receptor protein
VIGGVNRATIISNSYAYTTTDAQTASYTDAHLSPTASILYKASPAISTYATYSQGLENGGTAPVNTTNAGQIFEPLVDKSEEIGAKAAIGQAFATLALFDIDHAYDYSQTNSNGTFTYVQAGREDHKGIQFGLSGLVAPRITLYGGVTFLNPRVVDDPTLDGKTPASVSDELVKFYTEYAFAPRWALTGGVQYVSSFYADAANTQPLPGYTTGNVGARYKLPESDGHDVTFRLTVDNVGNKSYWLTSNYLGDPLTIAVSGEVSL